MAQNWQKHLPHTDHKNGVTELHLISGLIDTYMDTNESNLYIGGRGQCVSSARH